MRIGLDISLLGFEQPTGVGRVAEAVTKNLIREYPQVDFELFAFLPRGAASRIKSYPWIQEKNARLTLLTVPQKIFHSMARLWQQTGMLPIELLIRKKVDIFHHFDWYLYPTMAPLTATFYDVTPVTEPQWHTKDQVDLFRNWFDLLSERVIHGFAISESTKKDVVWLKPQLLGKVTVAYPGNDLTLDKQIRGTYDLPAKFFLAVGTIEPRKNIPALIKAFKYVRTLHPDIDLCVVGAAGWDLDSLRGLTAVKGVRYLNYVARTDLPALYKASIGVVYPSFYEGFGLPVVEAMAAGTIVITSPTSSLSEVGGPAAIYADPYQPDDLVRAMRQVIKLTPSQRQQRVMRGIRHVSQFSYSQAARTMMTVWQSIKGK